jgi:hypothetical protein
MASPGEAMPLSSRLYRSIQEQVETYLVAKGFDRTNSMFNKTRDLVVLQLVEDIASQAEYAEAITTKLKRYKGGKTKRRRAAGMSLAENAARIKKDPTNGYTYDPTAPDSNSSNSSRKRYRQKKRTTRRC